MADDLYEDLGYRREKLNPLLLKPVLNLESLSWEYDKQGRRIEKKPLRVLPEPAEINPPSSLKLESPLITNRQLRAKRARQRLRRLAAQAGNVQANAEYWETIKFFEELREKFDKDAQARQLKQQSSV